MRINSRKLEIQFKNKNEIIESSIDLLTKELSFCHKLRFFNPYIFATRSCRPLKFQTKNSDISNILSLKYKRFTFGFKDKVIRKLEFVARTQLISLEKYGHGPNHLINLLNHLYLFFCRRYLII